MCLQTAAIIDLRKAYLQIRVDEELWLYQVLSFNNKMYCLTRLGFGLSVAPKVMTFILRRVLSSSEDFCLGPYSYIDDIFVDLSKVSCEKVVSVLEAFGLQSKSLK